jgi:Spy/CpxP family protein refolding chaperone
MTRRTKIFAVGAVLVLALAVAAALAQGMHGHGGPMGMDEFGHGGGHMLRFYTKYLDLTTDQQAQIKSILQKEKPAVQPLMQQMHQFHSDMAKLQDSGTFDEAKVRNLAAQQSQTMTELIVQKERIKSEMLQVLTPEQKTKLAQLRAKHEQRMQEHMNKSEAPPSE